MPNIKSAKKRVNVAERNKTRNHAYKSSIRTAIKRISEAIQEKEDTAAVQTKVSTAFSLIDRAVLKGILHKKTGARYKSRIALKVNKVSA